MLTASARILTYFSAEKILGASYRGGVCDQAYNLKGITQKDKEMRTDQEKSVPDVPVLITAS